MRLSVLAFARRMNWMRSLDVSKKYIVVIVVVLKYMMPEAAISMVSRHFSVAGIDDQKTILRLLSKSFYYEIKTSQLQLVKH